MSRKDAWLPEQKDALFSVFDNTEPRKLNELMKPNAKVSEFLEHACEQVFGDTDPKLVTRVRSRVSRIKREFLDYLILLRDKERDPMVADEEYAKKLSFLYDRLPKGLIGLEVTFDLKEADEDEAVSKKKKPTPPPGTKPKALFRIPVDKEAIGFNRTPPPAEELVTVTQKYKLPGYGSGATVEKVGQENAVPEAAVDKSILIGEEDILSSSQNQISAEEALKREKMEAERVVQERQRRMELRRAEAKSLFDKEEEGGGHVDDHVIEDDHVEDHVMKHEVGDDHVDDHVEEEYEEEFEDISFKPFNRGNQKEGEGELEAGSKAKEVEKGAQKAKGDEGGASKTKATEKGVPAKSTEAVSKTGLKAKEVVSKSSEKSSESTKASETASKTSKSAKTAESSKTDKNSDVPVPRKRGRPKGSFKVKDGTSSAKKDATSSAKKDGTSSVKKANKSVREKLDTIFRSMEDNGDVSEEELGGPFFDAGLPTSTPKAPKRVSPSLEHSSPTKRNSMLSQRLSVYDDSDDDMFGTKSDIERTKTAALQPQRTLTPDLTALVPKRKRGRPRKDAQSVGEKVPKKRIDNKSVTSTPTVTNTMQNTIPQSSTVATPATVAPATPAPPVATSASISAETVTSNNLPQYFEGMQQFLSSVERLYMLADGDATMRRALAQLVVATTEKIEREKEE